MSKSIFKKLRDFKDDPNYAKYIENGDSAIIFITKKFVNIDTRNKWIDVCRRVNGYKLVCGGWMFESFVIELFQRIQYPDYSEAKQWFKEKLEDAYSEKDRKWIEETFQKKVDYITWKTATEDIHSQRGQGVKGKRYEVHLKLGNSDAYHRWVIERKRGYRTKPFKPIYRVVSLKRIEAVDNCSLTEVECDFTESREKDIAFRPWYEHANSIAINKRLRITSYD